MYILDSYAWVEYFLASNKGEKVKELFSVEENIFFTVECCLGELSSWCLRNKKDFNELFRVIRANSKILLVSQHNWIDVGKERFQQRKTQKDFGLIDAVLLVKQKELNCKVVTGDKHFKDLNDVVFLE